MKTILEELKIVHVAPDGAATTTYALAAGTTDKNSVAVDSLGFDRVAFVCTFGDNADTGTFTGSIEGSANGSTAWTAISGATQTFTAGATDSDDKMLSVGCGVNPTYRYYRFVSDRGVANTVIASLHALLGRAAMLPVTQLVTAGQFVAAPVTI